MDYFFSNSINGDLDNLGNWFEDFETTIPASQLPQVGDTATLNNGYVTIGTLTCDTIFANSEYFNDGIFNAANLYLYGGWTIDDGTFNCDIDAQTSFGYTTGGTFNGTFYISGQDTDNRAFIHGGVFTDDVTVADYSSILPLPSGNAITFTGRLRFRTSGEWIGTAAPDYPDAADVRSGVTYSEFTGTLDLPDGSDVRSGVDYDGETETGSLDLPNVSDVRDGVMFDNNTKEGTLGGGVITITVE